MPSKGSTISVPFGAKAVISLTTSSFSASVASGSIAFSITCSAVKRGSAGRIPKIFSRSSAEIGGSTNTGFTFTAGVIATGIRGALGNTAEDANAANASEPLGVLPTVIGVDDVLGVVTDAAKVA